MTGGGAFRGHEQVATKAAHPRVLRFSLVIRLRLRRWLWFCILSARFLLDRSALEFWRLIPIPTYSKLRQRTSNVRLTKVSFISSFYYKNPSPSEPLPVRPRTKDNEIAQKQNSSPKEIGYLLLLLALAVRLGGIVALVHDEVLRLVVLAAREVRVEDGLGAGRVPLLRVDRGARHVGDHGVASAPGIGGVAQRVILGRGLREPDVAAVAAEVAGLEGLGDILLDDDGAAGCVDEPGACSMSVKKLKAVAVLVYTPFFILEMSSLLNMPRVFSWSGQLIVTTSHCASISSRFSTRRQPISFSFSGLRGW